MTFTTRTPDEIERRRLKSVEALKAIESQEFNDWYQQLCDTRYWMKGKCCAGCDHWQSDMGGLGFCSAAGIVSGDQVMRSMGITFCSYAPEPGLPLTKADFYCGKFQDDFDWSQLDQDYLERIGAMKSGQLLEKPRQIADRGDL